MQGGDRRLVSPLRAIMPRMRHLASVLAPVFAPVFAPVLALVLATSACGSDIADVAGEYETVVTNQANGCNFENWNAGATSNISVTLAQQGDNVTLIVNGLVSFLLDAALGDHTFTGKVRGDTIDVVLFGTRSNTTGNCTYTFNAEIHAEVVGDALNGQIDYSAATNGNSSCATITNCGSYQDFTGTRVP